MEQNNNIEIQVDKKIIIRQFLESDFSELVKVDFRVWNRSLEFSAKKFKSITSIFPEGLFCAFVNGNLAGSITTMIRSYDLEHPIARWEEVSSTGMITDHDPKGNALYGISLGVSDEFRGLGVGARLIERTKQFVVERNLEYLALGSRIPFFHKYPNMNVQDFLNAKDDEGNRLDPEIRFYERCGLSVVEILPEYMSGKFADPESKNYGVLMCWMNPNKK
jgi:GNAT superfamily N-acetyltransferase